MKSSLFDYAVLVLGMHRSGTSALAGMLARCGLGIPSHLMLPNEGNERGFFESEPVNALNNEILGELGQTWLTLAPIPGACWDGKAIARRAGQLEALLAEEFAATRVPIIKDPRICRLLPLWRQVLDKAADEIRVAFIIRPPAEVAYSLDRRNQIDTEFGLLLWARYNLDAECNSRHLPRRFVSFDGLLRDWRGSLDKLDLPIAKAAIDAKAIKSFLSSDLRHHQSTESLPTAIELVGELFEILSQWTVEGERQEDYSSLDELRRKLDEMGPILGELTEKGRLERKRRTSLAAKSAAVEAQLATREQQFAGVANAIEQSLREMERKSDTLNAQVQRLGDEIARSTRLVEERDKAIQSLTVKNERLEHEVALATALANERAGELANATKEMSALRTAASEVDAELCSVKKKYRSTQDILARERSRATKLEERIKQAQAAIRELENSTAYRMIEGLRSLGRRASNILAFRGTSKSRRQRERRLINESRLFDAGWYLKSYPDVAKAGVDPVAHFAGVGWREGRNPSEAFCTTRYLKRYPDVAALGINPLIHFIEHGSFEGREVQGVGELPSTGDHLRKTSVISLAPAMPVHSARRDLELSPPWRRACHLASVQHAIKLDGLGLATVLSAQSQAEFDELISDFQALSGGTANLRPEAMAIAKLPRLQDGWFATSHRLVTRWKVDRPTVIRALQVDPSNDRLALVGEALASGELDLIEFDLASSTMPLLFIAVDTQGTLIGARAMAFPSLMRGGFHYPEWVAILDGGSEIDIVEASAGLENQLRLIRTGKAPPTVNALEVDLAGNDGTGPLFRRDIRDMLARVLVIDISSLAKSDKNNRERYLRESIDLTAGLSCRSGGGKLLLSADMLPALEILVSSSPAASRGARTAAMSLIVSDPDPSQPAVRFDMPGTKTSILKKPGGSYPLAFPQLRGGTVRSQLAAIRQLSRPLDDSEILKPDMSATAGDEAAAKSIDWLIDPGQWEEALLGQAVLALSLQEKVKPQRILFTRPPSDFIAELARSSFGSEPAIFDNLDVALADCFAPLVGHLGSGVVVHDTRTAAILSSMLLDAAVSSASCVLVASTKHGKSWRSRPIDGGSFAVDRPVVFGPNANSPAEMIWRATYPVIEPPRLWMSRPDELRRWRAGDRTGKEIHLVTSAISASLEADPPTDLDELSGILVPAAASRSISAKVLVG